MNTGELITKLGQAVAERRVIFTQETWYATPLREDHEEEWLLGIDPVNDGGTHGEWTIVWRDLGIGDTWQLRVFGDGLSALRASGVLDLLDSHQDADRATLREALLTAGWVDRTERVQVRDDGTEPSSTLELRLELDNAAFDNGPGPLEAARILRAAADKLDQGEWEPGTASRLRDVNGNTVGSFVVTNG